MMELNQSPLKHAQKTLDKGCLYEGKNTYVRTWGLKRGRVFPQRGRIYRNGIIMTQSTCTLCDLRMCVLLSDVEHLLDLCQSSALSMQFFCSLPVCIVPVPSHRHCA